MDVELLTVGTELLLGYTVDTNAAAAGRLLADAGFALALILTIWSFAVYLYRYRALLRAATR